jgi:hypothetical protein
MTKGTQRQTTGNTISQKQLEEFVKITAQLREPLMVWGAPGIGKSNIIQQGADDLFAGEYQEYEVRNGRCFEKATGKYRTRPWCIEIRGSLIQSYDLIGIPEIVDGFTRWAPPVGSLLPPHNGRGGILFIDELMNSEDENVRQALLGLINDRAIGSYTLPENWIIIAASNRAEDGTFAHQMGKHLGTRFWTHVVLEPNVDDWLARARKDGIDYRTIGYIQWRRDTLLVFDANDRGNSFPCPRIWYKIAQLNDLPPSIRTPAIIGALGEATGQDYLTFLTNFEDLPSIKEIKNNPASAPLPKRLDTLYVLTSSLANIADFASIAPFSEYLQRVSEEWQVLFFKECERLHPKLTKTRPFTEFRIKNGDLYI